MMANQDSIDTKAALRLLQDSCHHLTAGQSLGARHRPLGTPAQAQPSGLRSSWFLDPESGMTLYEISALG
ncbi:hypothetical protein I79_000191 [Cricetulus griseus]|uniref:Uncharacterized protein n=1 Tax=Cricetulus griseus TaxID=10029 RepID=G3GRP8_CRIGR|nr:hypothetical protein I79_000191 [Cricetulus griseus]